MGQESLQSIAELYFDVEIMSRNSLQARFQRFLRLSFMFAIGCLFQCFPRLGHGAGPRARPHDPRAREGPGGDLGEPLVLHVYIYIYIYIHTCTYNYLSFSLSLYIYIYIRARAGPGGDQGEV